MYDARISRRLDLHAAVSSKAVRKRKYNRQLCTGIGDLDSAFACAHDPSQTTAEGIPVNTFTELSGPPGSGKSAIWLALILETLRRGQDVLYLGCNHIPFPFHRAEKLDKWDPKYRSHITDRYVKSIEQLLLIERFFDMASFGLVVISHYEVLVKSWWSLESRARTLCAVLKKLGELREFSTILASVGAIKYKDEENLIQLTSRTARAKVLPGLVRLMVYKDRNGNSVLSSGEKFRVATSGIVPSPDPPVDPMPPHILSARRPK